MSMKLYQKKYKRFSEFIQCMAFKVKFKVQVMIQYDIVTSFISNNRTPAISADDDVK